MIRRIIAHALGACVLTALATTTQAETFGKGLLADSPEAIAAVPPMPSYRAYLPSKVDLSPYLAAIGNQGPQGSCAAWATSYTAMGIMFNHELESRLGALAQTDKLSFSPAYIYNLIHRGQCDGTTLTTALNAIRDNGLAKMQDFPYNPAACSSQPDDSLLRQSKTKRLLHYTIVDTAKPEALDKIRGALYEGKPVVIGMYTGDDHSAFERYRGGIFDATLPQTGGHAMTIVGYDDEAQAFRIANSWGDRWGEHGYMRSRYESLLANLNEHYVYVVDQVDPSGIDTLLASIKRPPTPTPAPEPAPTPNPAPAPKPSPAPGGNSIQVASQIGSLPAAHSCARINASAQGDEIVLTGFTGNKTALLSAIHTLTAPAHFTLRTDALQELPWPQCEVKENYDMPSIWRRNGFGLHVAGIPADGHAATGTSLKIQLSAAKTPSYLYVFYMQALRERNVVPLYQPLFDKGGRPLAERLEGVVNLNDPAPGLHHDFVVNAPYGPEVILAIQTRTPLFKHPLAPGDWNERYLLTRLRSEIAQQQKHGGILGTDMVYLTTRE